MPENENKNLPAGLRPETQKSRINSSGHNGNQYCWWYWMDRCRYGRQSAGRNCRRTTNRHVSPDSSRWLARLGYWWVNTHKLRTNPRPTARHCQPDHRRHTGYCPACSAGSRSCTPRLYREYPDCNSMAFINSSAPRVSAVIRPARRQLPLRLSGQFHPGPFAIGFGLTPGHIDDRVIIKQRISIITRAGG